VEIKKKHIFVLDQRANKERREWKYVGGT